MENVLVDLQLVQTIHPINVDLKLVKISIIGHMELEYKLNKQIKEYFIYHGYDEINLSISSFNSFISINIMCISRIYQKQNLYALKHATLVNLYCWLKTSVLNFQGCKNCVINYVGILHIGHSYWFDFSNHESMHSSWK